MVIDKIVPGTSAAISGEMAVNDEILEIAATEVKDLVEDKPNSEELMKRLQEILNSCSDHVTLKVFQEDGLTKTYRTVRGPIVVPGIQVRLQTREFLSL